MEILYLHVYILDYIDLVIYRNTIFQGLANSAGLQALLMVFMVAFQKAVFVFPSPQAGNTMFKSAILKLTSSFHPCLASWPPFRGTSWVLACRLASWLPWIFWLQLFCLPLTFWRTLVSLLWCPLPS